jgi:molybdate transport system ATP-binding protein
MDRRAEVTLDARVGVRLGEFEADVPLGVARGEVVALLGPNGSGKTTVLRALAGLLPLASGHVRLTGRTLEDSATGVRVPAARRRIGLVFQDHLLFPHLTALENVAFGPRCGGISRVEARRRAAGWLERLDLADAAGRHPGRLSGGEAQRVALARALATEPELLLMDEPLSALDTTVRPRVRAELRRHLAAFHGPTLVVTHDPVDAMVLAGRLIVVEHGRVVQDGVAEEVTRHPRSEWVARLVGLNLFRGRSVGDRVEIQGPDRKAFVVPVDPVEGEVLVAFRPEAVALYPEAPEGSPRNVWSERVTGLEGLGARVRVQLEGDLPMTADVTPAAVGRLELEPGRRVFAAVKATEVAVYPA